MALHVSPEALIQDGEIKEELFKDGLMPYKRLSSKKSSRGKLKTFQEYLGIKNGSAEVHTKLGNVSVNVNSQFFKMLKAKDNRENLLLGIKETLESPLLIYREDDSFKFINGFKKGNGDVFYMTSICREHEDGLVLVTNYQLKTLNKVKGYLNGDRGVLLYNGVGTAVEKTQRSFCSETPSESSAVEEIIANKKEESQPISQNIDYDWAQEYTPNAP
jgi:hypothetical protein